MANPSNRERIENRGNKIGDSGRASERRVAADLRGELTPASGAMASAKGDVRRGAFLIESKATTKQSIGVKLRWLAKITIEAQAVEKIPALAIQFLAGEAGHSRRGGDWVAIPRYIFDELTDEDE